MLHEKIKLVSHFHVDERQAIVLCLRIVSLIGECLPFAHKLEFCVLHLLHFLLQTQFLVLLLRDVNLSHFPYLFHLLLGFLIHLVEFLLVLVLLELLVKILLRPLFNLRLQIRYLGHHVDSPFLGLRYLLVHFCFLLARLEELQLSCTHLPISLLQAALQIANLSLLHLGIEVQCLHVLAGKQLHVHGGMNSSATIFDLLVQRSHFGLQAFIY